MEDNASEKPWWSELVKEMALSGLATVFMTEDMIRNQLKDLKLPKEIVGLMLESVGKKKEELYATFGREFSKVLSKVDLGKEIAHFLESHEVKVEMKLLFKEIKKG